MYHHGEIICGIMIFSYNYVSPCQSVGFVRHLFIFKQFINVGLYILDGSSSFDRNNVVMEHIFLLFSERLERGRLLVSLTRAVHQRQRRRRPRKTPTSLKDHPVLSSCSCLYLSLHFLFRIPKKIF